MRVGLQAGLELGLGLGLGLGLLAGWAGAQGRPSPDLEVHEDGTATFRFHDPSATAVKVALEGVKQPMPMQKDAAGLWTLTTEKLPPEYYGYHFEVDGRNVLDTRNTAVKLSMTELSNEFLVPGAPAGPWEVTAVPHGTLHQETYTSKVVLGLTRGQSEFFVYTPPGYDARAKTKYPVLYLLHGWSDTAQGWSEIGKAHRILDNLIAAGKVKPMIVVMPLGYGDMSFVQSGHSQWDDVVAVERNRSRFEQALLTEVLPRVESGYQVSARREDRAIAGLSMGGLESVTIGLKRTDLFAYVGGFSSAVAQLHPESMNVEENRQGKPLKVLWIACGTGDDLMAPNRRMIAGLKARGLPVTAIETPGIHSWLVWRDNLVNFAPLLFQGQ